MENLFTGWIRCTTKDGSLIFDAFFDNMGMTLHPHSGVVVVYYSAVEPNKPIMADVMSWASFVAFVTEHRPTILQKGEYLTLEGIEHLFSE